MPTDPAQIEVIVIGSGGFGRELAQYAIDTGRFIVRGVLDDRPAHEVATPFGVPLLGTIMGYQPAPGQSFLLAVGNPTVRTRIAESYVASGACFETVVHPLAYVAMSATIGQGAVIAPFATVGANAVIGELAQVHYYASVAHDAAVGRFSALSPYSVVNGGGQLGHGAFLGTRATVNPTKRVGDFSRIAAGAVVYHDVPGKSFAAGNPAKARPLMTCLPQEQQEPIFP